MTEATKIRMADKAFDAHFDKKKRYYREPVAPPRTSRYSIQRPSNFAAMLTEAIAIREAIDANDKKFEKMKYKGR